MSVFFSIDWIYWDPPRVAFTVPLIDRPVVWYGVLFVLGFFLAYFIILPIFTRFFASVNYTKQTAHQVADKLCWFAVAGTLIGARLAQVFFYDWPYFSTHPVEIFKIWNGGLASHGGVLGVMIALFLFVKYVRIPGLTFIRLLDFVAIPSALVACFIRLGNFMNQEVVGIPTDLPWAVLFVHPADGLSAIPRHPVQLYEAVAYLATFFILWSLWKYQRLDEKPGALIGLLFIFIFGSRFIIEYWKAPFLSAIEPSLLQIGQILSIPFILLGLYLFFRTKALEYK